MANPNHQGYQQMYQHPGRLSILRVHRYTHGL